MTPAFDQISASPDQTRDIGRALGSVLRSGDFLALEGPLGAGKTQFIKGVAAGLGVPADEPVVSPTFVLVREYAGRLKLYHIDAYRLLTTADLLSLGLEEFMLDSGAVVALEWADRTPAAIPDSACRIVLEHVDEHDRHMRMEWNSPGRLDEFLSHLTARPNK
jgi:tRNA threonylcarbamoyladenosine biosynthesis protein TsaE